MRNSFYYFEGKNKYSALGVRNLSERTKRVTAIVQSCSLLPGRHHNPTHNQRERGDVVQVRQFAQKGGG